MGLIVLPPNVKLIIDMLKNAGFEAFAVGGCVRDSLLGRVPFDWDITTNAGTDSVMSVFSKYNVVPCGLKHGTVTVVIEGVPYEITTYRIDGKYTDSRRPDEVYFTQSLSEDLKRRDFTINAMAYNEEAGLVDLFNGEEDLRNGVIRCVGDASERFSEDALRMMRAVRFAAQLGFSIEPGTLEGIVKKAFLLEKISIERITSEFNKILLSDHVDFINILLDTGLMKYIVPEFIKCANLPQDDEYHIYDVGTHILKSVSSIESKLVLRLAMFFHDIGKPECMTMDDNGRRHFYGHPEVSANMAANIMKRMRYDNNTICLVKTLVLHHDIQLSDDEVFVRRWINKIGQEAFENLLKVVDANIKAQNPRYYKTNHDKLRKVQEIMNQVISNNECCSLSKLAVNGRDLVSIGISPGPCMGKVLEKLLDMVLENPKLNEKSVLLEHAVKLYEEFESKKFL